MKYDLMKGNKCSSNVITYQIIDMIRRYKIILAVVLSHHQLLERRRRLTEDHG